MRVIILPFVLVAILFACQSKENNDLSVGANPASDGFDLANSDPAAIELADSIMTAMGGRKNWDDTRFISWNFSGTRNFVWDKKSGRVRIENLPDNTIYLMNLNTGEGKVKVKDEEVTQPDSLKKMLDEAKEIWVNDSYWLVMPFKLKDDGVTLKYLGEDSVALAPGKLHNVLQLTVQNTGDTSHNKYKVYVDIHDNLVNYLSYYSNAVVDTADFTLVWDNYQKYGSIILSADRSDGSGPAKVKVDEELPDAVFTEF